MKADIHNEQVAHKMIKILQDAGYTPDQMIKVICLARRKHLQMKLNSQVLKN